MSMLDCLRIHEGMLLPNYEMDITFFGEKKHIKRFAKDGTEAVPFMAEHRGRKIVIKIDKTPDVDGLGGTQKSTNWMIEELDNLRQDYPSFSVLKKFEVIPLQKSPEGYYYQRYIDGVLIRDAGPEIQAQFWKLKESILKLGDVSHLGQMLPENVIYVPEKDIFYIIDPH